MFIEPNLTKHPAPFGGAECSGRILLCLSSAPPNGVCRGVDPDVITNRVILLSLFWTLSTVSESDNCCGGTKLKPAYIKPSGSVIFRVYKGRSTKSHELTRNS